jgi:hypothetical protein
VQFLHLGRSPLLRHLQTDRRVGGILRSVPPPWRTLALPFPLAFFIRMGKERLGEHHVSSVIPSKLRVKCHHWSLVDLTIQASHIFYPLSSKGNFTGNSLCSPKQHPTSLAHPKAPFTPCVHACLYQHSHGPSPAYNTRPSAPISVLTVLTVRIQCQTGPAQAPCRAARVCKVLFYKTRRAGSV